MKLYCYFVSCVSWSYLSVISQCSTPAKLCFNLSALLTLHVVLQTSYHIHKSKYHLVLYNSHPPTQNFKTYRYLLDISLAMIANCEHLKSKIWRVLPQHILTSYFSASVCIATIFLLLSRKHYQWELWFFIQIPHSSSLSSSSCYLVIHTPPF